MKDVPGESFSLENAKLAELECRTGITRARLRRMKANGFKSVPHGLTGKKADPTVLNGDTSTLDGVFCNRSVGKAVVCLCVAGITEAHPAKCVNIRFCSIFL